MSITHIPSKSGRTLITHIRTFEPRTHTQDCSFIIIGLTGEAPLHRLPNHYHYWINGTSSFTWDAIFFSGPTTRLTYA